MYELQQDSAEEVAKETIVFTSFLELSTLECQTIQDLRAMIDDDLAFSDLITVYINSAKILIDKIQEAFIDNDTENLRIASHSLKSTSASVGATKLSQICKFVEQTSREGETTITAEFINDVLVGEYNLLVQEIKTYVTAY
ncbi:Hpt domain-containing protein [Pseudanabaena sp. FACHB-1277]|jgi:HPt (histidine-containing phosphotransfer) domain-containing protein|uniref:Hpt domain-containing protein n=1 Tax=Pseudanabaena cinerea FACHB-1277 TaxID=2949581 RepID=A0A926USM7_9CYAN|nr:Hpt domain-containing protein [Pseudanabaena cinerea]MBD2150344.1 Hpt domain-containing protein [Pseudanabaena cinerea FACHB-1277]